MANCVPALLLLLTLTLTSLSFSPLGLDLDTGISSRLRSREAFPAKLYWREDSGLFFEVRDMARLRKDRWMHDVFVVNNSTVAFPFQGACNVPAAGGRDGCSVPACGRAQPQRAGETLNAANWIGTTEGCCNTMMQVEFPQVVTSLITGHRHRVVQFATSSQVVHTGTCNNEGNIMTVIRGEQTNKWRGGKGLSVCWGDGAPPSPDYSGCSCRQRLSPTTTTTTMALMMKARMTMTVLCLCL